MKPPLEVLKGVFEYPAFRPGQAAIINSIIKGRDTLALMPTGGGKSLCFQIPGLCLGGTTVVISPLLSLMQDQVAHLVAKGITACSINSTLEKEVRQNLLRAVSEGQFQFVYVSPETLASASFVSAVSNTQIKLVVIDEAHCIDEWGHDFRPEYLQINNFVAFLSNKPVVAAFTATATLATQKVITSSLKLHEPQVFKQSFKRDNLNLSIKICPDRFTQELLLGRILDKHRDQMGIIYSSTRESTEYLARYLGRYYTQIAAYHGGMTSSQRSKIQADFQSGGLKIIVATNAFGMGVDQSSIRFVVHYHIPSSLEAYYQEIGRAGRDGALAETYGLFFLRDLGITTGFLPDRHSPLYPAKAYKLQKMLEFINYQGCRYQVLLDYFGETAAKQCKNCDQCSPVSWERGLLEDQRYQNFLYIRDKIARNYQITPSQLMTTQVVKLLALYQPQNQTELSQIPGLGRGWRTQWGSKIEPYLSSHT